MCFLEIGERLTAYFNPKEIGVQQQVSWKEQSAPKGDAPFMEFTTGGGRSMTLELFFDTYESGENVHKAFISKLEKGMRVMDAKEEKLKRPPTLLIAWGSGFPKFLCVMEALDVKYTMFFKDGTPCRATASIKLKETVRKDKRKGDQPLENVRDYQAAFDRGLRSRPRGRH